MSPATAPLQPEPAPGSPFELERLEAEARYHRDRLALYRARLRHACGR